MPRIQNEQSGKYEHNWYMWAKDQARYLWPYMTAISEHGHATFPPSYFKSL